MAYTTSTKYVNKQMYLDFAGIDLDIELKKGNYDNPTKAVEIFLYRTQEWVYNYIQSHYFHDDIFDEEAFKKAVMHQVDYIRRNGDLSLSAVNAGTLLAPNALQVLRLAGMCNLWQPNAYYYGENDGS